MSGSAAKSVNWSWASLSAGSLIPAPSAVVSRRKQNEAIATRRPQPLNMGKSLSLPHKPIKSTVQVYGRFATACSHRREEDVIAIAIRLLTSAATRAGENPGQGPTSGKGSRSAENVVDIRQTTFIVLTIP